MKEKPEKGVGGNMKKKFLPVLVAMTLILLNSYSYTQEIWFEWLNHINAIQEEWIRVEKDTFSIWNNITKFQNFNALKDRTSSLIASIKKMRHVHDEDKSKYGKKYQKFFQLSSQYLISLEQTITNLETILKRLDDKTKDINSYTWEEYSNDIESYKKSADTYHSLGNKMNEEFKKIQQNK